SVQRRVGNGYLQRLHGVGTLRSQNTVALGSDSVGSGRFQLQLSKRAGRINQSNFRQQINQGVNGGDDGVLA
ncbi:hypothetical protein OGATHE_000764, partial [Ogataea polymorpha]